VFVAVFHQSQMLKRFQTKQSIVNFFRTRGE
jgi:hypothetical protein